MSKATHTGECQICGRRQMLPSDFLSKHGYTTRWGFFSGICQGAGFLPYEQSCERIKPIREAVARQVADLREAAPEVAAQADPNDVWEEVYLRERGIGAGYQWRKVKLRNAEVVIHGDTFYTLQHDRGEDKWERLDVYGDGLYDSEKRQHNLRAVALYLNGKRAQSMLDAAKQREEYLRWCDERIANWTLKPLTPRKD